MNTQFKKGVLEMCILALLKKHDMYGFELVSQVSRHVDMSEGTVYPLMKRLMDEALLTTYLAESPSGPPRKYYHLTDKGARAGEALLGEWRSFCRHVEDLLEGAQA